MKRFYRAGAVVGFGLLLPFVAGAYGSLVSPVISSLTPSSGQAGVAVTINGSGFTSCLSCADSTRRDVIRFGTAASITVTPDSDSALTFTIPAALTPTCPSGGCTALELSGDYSLTVINNNGITSNPMTLTVTAAPPPYPTPYPTPYTTPYGYPTPAPVVETQPTVTQPAPVQTQVQTTEVKQANTKSESVKSKEGKVPSALSDFIKSQKDREPDAVDRFEARVMEYIKGWFKRIKQKVSSK